MTDTENSCRCTEKIPYMKLYCSYCETFVFTAVRISELWPVWLYNIIHISAHCGLSVSTVYSKYQRSVVCLDVQYIPYISTLWSVCLYNIFHILAHYGLSDCTLYSTYERTVVCLAVQYVPHISALWPVWPYNIFHISAHCVLCICTIYSTSAHFDLSFSTIYTTYQRNVVCLAVKYIPHYHTIRNI